MDKKEFDDYIQELKGKLPSPSEVEGDMTIPHGIYGWDDELGCPLFGQITFTKDIHDGIAIGWKLKDSQ